MPGTFPGRLAVWVVTEASPSVSPNRLEGPKKTLATLDGAAENHLHILHSRLFVNSETEDGSLGIDHWLARRECVPSLSLPEVGLPVSNSAQETTRLQWAMPAEWIFKVAFLALFSGAVAIRVRYQRMAGTYEKGMVAHTENHLVHEARPLLIIRPLLGFPWYAVVLCWFFAPQWVRWSFIAMPGWLRMGGLLLAALGLLLLWRSHAAMGKNFRPTLEISQQQELVTSGPYSFVRHPLYAAFLMMLASTGLLSANWFIGVVGVLLIASICFWQVGLAHFGGLNWPTLRR
jgi:isoprenylcysteine carboxyl methyltransferase (ICMT) family protein YpbQ